MGRGLTRLWSTILERVGEPTAVVDVANGSLPGAGGGGIITVGLVDAGARLLPGDGAGTGTGELVLQANGFDNLKLKKKKLNS